MKIRKIFWLYLFLLLVDMLVIFAFSGQSAKSSSKLSKDITSNVIEHTIGVNEDKTKAAFQFYYTEIVVRKSAHAMLFAILGFAMTLSLKSAGFIKNMWMLLCVSFILCILYAISDEYHQTFIDGRSKRISDVLIDGAGSLLGIVAVWLGSKKFSFGIK